MDKNENRTVKDSLFVDYFSKDAAGLSEGRSEGARNARIETARKFLSMNILPEQIAQGTGLSVDEVLSLKD